MIYNLMTYTGYCVYVGETLFDHFTALTDAVEAQERLRAENPDAYVKLTKVTRTEEVFQERSEDNIPILPAGIAVRDYA